MAESMKVLTVMIRKKATASSFGRTVESTKEVGSMVNNTELGHTHLQVERQRKVSGKMAKE